MAPPLEIDIPSRRGRGRAANQLDLLERRADQLLFGLRSLGDPAEDGSPQGFNVSTQRVSPGAPPSASHTTKQRERRAGPITPTSARRSQASTLGGGVKRASTTRAETVRKRKVPKVAYTSRFIAEAQERADRRSSGLLQQVRQKRMGATNDWDKHGPADAPPQSQRRSPVKPAASAKAPQRRRVASGPSGGSAPPTSRSLPRPSPLSPSAALSHGPLPRRSLPSSTIPFSRFNARASHRSPLSLTSPLQTVPEGPTTSTSTSRADKPRKSPIQRSNGGKPLPTHATATASTHANTSASAMRRPSTGGVGQQGGAGPAASTRHAAPAPSPRASGVWVRSSCTQTGVDANLSGPCGVPVLLPPSHTHRRCGRVSRALSPIRGDIVQRVLARQHTTPSQHNTSLNRSALPSHPPPSDAPHISIRTGEGDTGGEIRLRILPHTSNRPIREREGTQSDRWPDLSHLANALEMLGVQVGRPFSGRTLSGDRPLSGKRARSPTASEWAAAVDPSLERSASRSRLRPTEENRGVSRGERVGRHMQASHRSQLWKELQQKLDVLEEQEHRVRQRYNLPPRQDNGPSNRHHNDETIIDEGTPSPHKSLIEIAVPLDEERASPSRPKHAPPSASLLSIQHDPSLVNELEAYRQTFHRHTQACEATRIKTALPEWQIVSMLSEKLLEDMLEGCTGELEAFVQNYAETLFMSL